jgi:hypothetical protein
MGRLWANMGMSMGMGMALQAMLVAGGGLM